MNDIASYLWIIFAIVAAVFSAVKSDKTKKRQQASKRVLREDKPRTAPPPASRQPTTPESPFAAKRREIEMNRKAQGTNRRSDFEPETAGLEESDEPVMICTDNFKLRDAVIYSEILKPKFEDRSE